MIQLNDDIILSNIQQSSSNSHILFIVFGSITILITILTIIISVKFKKKTDKFKYKEIFYKMVAPLFFFIGTIIFLNNYNAYNYVITNKSWAVTTDTIVDKNYNLHDSDGISSYHYFVTLLNNGKCFVSDTEYNNLNNGDSVYVVLIKGKNGKVFSSQIYSTNNYYYDNVYK